MRSIYAFIFSLMFASSGWAARNIPIPECPYTGHSTCSDGRDNNLDGTVDEAAPAAAFVASSSDYNAEAENCLKVGSWTDTTDSAANNSHYLSNPLGQYYNSGQIACPGNFTNGTYYLWALIRNPGSARALWVSTSVITDHNNSSQAAIVQTQSNFTWVAIGTTGSTSNFRTRTNGTAQRTFALNGDVAFYIASEPGVQIDCLFVSTSASAQASCPTGTPPPTPNYTILTVQATPPASCSDSSWGQANIMPWNGFSSTTDGAPTMRLQWKSAGTSLLYGCITVPDANIITATAANDDPNIFTGGDDYFEMRIAPDLTHSTAGTWKIAMNAASVPAVYDASYDASDTPTTSYSASCSKTRTNVVGVSWSIFFICNIGFNPAANSVALFETFVGDAESTGYTYRIAFGAGAFDTNDPTKWGIVKYSSTVTPVPPADTTPPVVTSPTSLNIGTATADVRATSDEAGTGRARYATSSGGYPSAATCAASPGTSGCSATTNCPASTCTINLSGLTANTTYYFRFDVTDTSNNVGTSAEANFTTAASGAKYVSPSGSGTTCSSGSPCAVSYFIANAAAGETWRFKNGTYSPLSLNCSANFRNGNSGSPITLTADNERQALIQGAGSEEGVLALYNCHWINLVGFHVETTDFNGGNDNDVIFIYNSSDITVHRNIIAHTNRYKNSHPVMLYTSSNITVTENEIYYSHRSGIDIYTGGSGMYVARNYLNKRGWTSIIQVPGGPGGVQCYPCTNSVIANNIAEGWTSEGGNPGVGFAQQAWGSTGANTKWLGNIGLNNSYGFLFNARLETQTEVRDNTAINNVIIGSPYGYYIRTPHNFICQNCTVISDSSAQWGIALDVDTSQWFTPPYSFTITNSLAINGTNAYGFQIAGGSGWSGTMDHNNAYNNAINFSVGGGVTSTNATTTNPNLGTCKIFIPDGTAMKGAGVGGADIGANVLYYYDTNGSLTGTKLWNSSGVPQFKGATVSGLNDVAGSSLFDVQNRLNIGQNGCSTPAGY